MGLRQCFCRGLAAVENVHFLTVAAALIVKGENVAAVGGGDGRRDKPVIGNVI